MTLTLDQALTIARETLAEGERRGMLPLAVMVLDHAGQPLALLRDHRSSLHRADIATAKAAGCMAMGLGGRELAKRAAGNPAFIGAVSQLFPRGLVPVAGGLLVRDDAGVLVGAVGVSGGDSAQDQRAVDAGVRAFGDGGDG